MTVKVVLIGLPGSGKSTTGRRLAKILAVPFADSDELVEAATGRHVRELFATAGEDGFRELETAAIATALERFDGVLALGGGAVLSAKTRAALEASAVPIVLLQAPLPTLAIRVGDGRTRPLLAADPPGRLATLATEREPLYAALATMTVQTENRTLGQVAAHIAAKLHERTPK
ncbi:MAG: shikimate kinase [Jatrophihabitantaceae bacterium]